MKVLQIVECAYRATIEEQDDTIVWLAHAMKGAGAELSVLLRGNAVNYAVRGQDAAGIAIGAWRQTEPPRLGEDVAALVAKGVDVYLLKEDAETRGLAHAELVPGIRRVTRAGLPALMDAHDGVWQW
jgi:sulfur transfer complex TusBCD TusB component (DsrH family)